MNGFKPVFQTENQFTDKFDRFHNGRLFSRLERKFTPKPYHEQYKLLRIIAVAASYLFNILSASTAFVLVFFFLSEVIGSAIVATILTGAALIVFEVAKRETSGRLFANWFQYRRPQIGLGAVVVLLSAMSITSSYFGSQRAVREFTPPAELVTQDSVTNQLQARLTLIDVQIADAKKTTWKGKLTRPAQRIVEKLTNQREQVTKALLDREKRVQDGNDHTEQVHQADTTSTGVKFALFTALAELLFLLCAGYIEFYDYRSFVEYCEQDDADPEADDPGTKRPAERIKPKVNGQQYHIVANETDPATTKIVHARADDNRQRSCNHCGKPYTYNHAKQKYCSTECRISAWEEKTGKRLKRKPESTG